MGVTNVQFAENSEPVDEDAARDQGQQRQALGEINTVGTLLEGFADDLPESHVANVGSLIKKLSATAVDHSNWRELRRAEAKE